MSFGIIFENSIRQQRKAYRSDVDLTEEDYLNITLFLLKPENKVWEDICDSVKRLNLGFQRIDLDCPVEATNHPDQVLVILVSE